MGLEKKDTKSQLQYTEQSSKGYMWTVMGFMQLQIFAKEEFLLATDHDNNNNIFLILKGAYINYTSK